MFARKMFARISFDENKYWWELFWRIPKMLSAECQEEKKVYISI